jgi:uncharacterized membrane protein HdeD (DUF308 family)
MPTLFSGRLKRMFKTSGLEPRARAGRLIIGMLLLMAGGFAVTSAWTVSFVTLAAYGVLLLFAGALESVHALQRRRAGDALPHALAAVFCFIVGALFLTRPVATLASVTALLGAYFIASGLFRILAALLHRNAGWGWTVLRGSVSLILGVVVFASWEISSLALLGLLIGAELIASGLAVLALPAAPVRSPAGARSIER